ncbi:hypothetical protein D3C79_1027390 [compost metagenome]
MALRTVLTTTAATDFIDHWDHDRCTSCLIVENMGNLILELLLQDIHVDTLTTNTRNFLLEVLTNHAHKLLAIT